MYQLNIIILIQCLLLSGTYAATGCEIDPLADGAPLLIRTGTNTIIYPAFGERTVKFDVGETVEFSCPQTTLLLDGDGAQTIAQATCISNQRFRVGNNRFLWRQITCSSDPISFSRFASGTCGSSTRLAEVGFLLDATRFARTITVCFSTRSQTALWSQAEISSTIAISSMGAARPAFEQDDGFYSFNVNARYVRNGQRRAINRLLGLENSSTKYVQAGNVFFLARGHLVARADFVYAAQKNSTFKYINAAPQWQSFNGGNWEQAESDTRLYASSKNVSLQVWTGTYGVATLPHENSGEQVELYLYVDGEEKFLPVPALYWKLVYDPVSRKGVVLVGVNNPYETNLAKYVVCQDVSSRVGWLKWDKTNNQKGYSYACEAAAFRKAVAYAPNVPVTGLLV